jgi:hypothetical protein
MRLAKRRADLNVMNLLGSSASIHAFLSGNGPEQEPKTHCGNEHSGMGIENCDSMTMTGNN